MISICHFLKYIDRYSYPSYEILQLVFKKCSYTPCKSQFKNGKKCQKTTFFHLFIKVFPLLFHYFLKYVDRYSYPSYENLHLAFKNCLYIPCKSQFKNGKECRKTTFFYILKVFPLLFHYVI